MRSIEITRVTEFDQEAFDVISKLLLDLVSKDQLPNKQQFTELINSQNSELYIARITGTNKTVGTFTIGTYQIPTGKRIWIEDVVVDTEQRGKGIGRALIDFAVERCEAMGGKDTRLTSRTKRVAANKLYQSVGFERHMTNVYRRKHS
ncbi:MAG: GNAT family N-acetyltransferase [Bacteroidales bacterium]